MSKKINILVFYYAVFSVVLFIATSIPVCAEVPQISCEELNTMQAKGSEKLTIVDVRRPYEFGKGHIPNSINVPYNTVGKADLSKDGLLVFYCSNTKCPLSYLAAKTLINSGYTNVKVLEGGISKWHDAGFSLESEPGTEFKKPATVKIQRISTREVRKRLEDKTLGILDVRPAKEYKASHIPGARSAPLESLISLMQSFSKETEWVVYDRRPNRSREAAKVLMAKGLKVRELLGGLQVWSAKKFPLEVGDSK